ncbi:hypothetical protein [Planococcus versutus]|uniref:Uncharacterized protein n=1 Tax=Planococcus versutus TaxID=1302659 RepID=A0A1B1S5H7_9BACL|nr:hypothetical protein [Planococcus versutus]ANU28431.1 hypothetical protein I858_015685 [Planococcus versutus]
MEVHEIPENQTDIFEMFEYIEKEKSQKTKSVMKPTDKLIVRLNEHHFKKNFSSPTFNTFLKETNKQEGELFSIEEFRRWERLSR